MDDISIRLGRKQDHKGSAYSDRRGPAPTRPRGRDPYDDEDDYDTYKPPRSRYGGGRAPRDPDDYVDDTYKPPCSRYGGGRGPRDPDDYADDTYRPPRSRYGGGRAPRDVDDYVDDTYDSRDGYGSGRKSGRSTRSSSLPPQSDPRRRYGGGRRARSPDPSYDRGRYGGGGRYDEPDPTYDSCCGGGGRSKRGRDPLPPLDDDDDDDDDFPLTEEPRGGCGKYGRRGAALPPPSPPPRTKYKSEPGSRKEWSHTETRRSYSAGGRRPTECPECKMDELRSGGRPASDCTECKMDEIRSEMQKVKLAAGQLNRAQAEDRALAARNEQMRRQLAGLQMAAGKRGPKAIMY